MKPQGSKENSSLGSTLPRSGSKENATPTSKPATRNGRPTPLVTEIANGEIRRKNNNFINESFNSPNAARNPRENLSLNESDIQGTNHIKSNTKHPNQPVNAYNVDTTATNKRASMSIQSTPTNDNSGTFLIQVLSHRNWKRHS